MNSDRPVVLTVERKTIDVGAKGFYPEADLMITHMRQMGRLEYAWHRLKQRLTPQPTHITEVTDDALDKAGITGRFHIGIELSMNLWNKLVSKGDCAELKSWGWLNKYSSILLSPIPPTSMSSAEFDGSV